MPDSKCPLCHATQSQRLFSVGSHDLLSCDVCELIYIWPYPQDSGQVYDSVSDYKYDDLEIMSAETHFESSKLAYARIYPHIRPYYQTADATLDVGCGTGYLLDQLREFPQLKRVGIELNVPRAAFARRAAECDVYEQPVQQFDTDQRFDVITMIAVFSHAPDFAGLYSSLRNLLTPNGKLILHVGEFARNVKRNAVFDWEVPDHLHFMGLKTAQYLADHFGYKIVHHYREPLADLIFARTTWRAPGRSAARNRIKRLVTLTPGALTLLKSIYKLRHGTSIYNSIIVFERTEMG
ncbi:MAG: class I SAM-dependent methyltransferase [Planctomycetales bacterium]|nr:class I SAM-dependent methyltransferase [Planctomycetales bacterium]MCA9169632.1 class I SAM-dependent methyltransferase [Planctomycetales bacterium]